MKLPVELVYQIMSACDVVLLDGHPARLHMYEEWYEEHVSPDKIWLSLISSHLPGPMAFDGHCDPRLEDDTIVLKACGDGVTVRVVPLFAWQARDQADFVDKYTLNWFAVTAGQWITNHEATALVRKVWLQLPPETKLRIMTEELEKTPNP